MKTRFLIILVVVLIIGAIGIVILNHYISVELDPEYVKEKIIQLQEMPCEDMGKNHVHEIEHPDHYSVYDEKFMECFGYIP